MIFNKEIEGLVKKFKKMKHSFAEIYPNGYGKSSTIGIMDQDRLSNVRFVSPSNSLGNRITQTAKGFDIFLNNKSTPKEEYLIKMISKEIIEDMGLKVGTITEIGFDKNIDVLGPKEKIGKISIVDFILGVIALELSIEETGSDENEYLFGLFKEFDKLKWEKKYCPLCNEILSETNKVTINDKFNAMNDNDKTKKFKKIYKKFWKSHDNIISVLGNDTKALMMKYFSEGYGKLERELETSQIIRGITFKNNYLQGENLRKIVSELFYYDGVNDKVNIEDDVIEDFKDAVSEKIGFERDFKVIIDKNVLKITGITNQSSSEEMWVLASFLIIDAIHSDYEHIVIDDPTDSMDKFNKMQFLSIISILATSKGKKIMILTHDVDTKYIFNKLIEAETLNVLENTGKRFIDLDLKYPTFISDYKDTFDSMYNAADEDDISAYEAQLNINNHKAIIICMRDFGKISNIFRFSKNKRKTHTKYNTYRNIYSEVSNSIIHPKSNIINWDKIGYNMAKHRNVFAKSTGKIKTVKRPKWNLIGSEEINSESIINIADFLTLNMSKKLKYYLYAVAIYRSIEEVYGITKVHKKFWEHRDNVIHIADWDYDAIETINERTIDDIIKRCKVDKLETDITKLIEAKL